jgi:hypothetical protein
VVCIGTKTDFAAAAAATAAAINACLSGCMTCYSEQLSKMCVLCWPWTPHLAAVGRIIAEQQKQKQQQQTACAAAPQ